MEDKMQLILYRGVEMRVPCGFDWVYKKYGTEDGMETLGKDMTNRAQMFRTIETIFSDRAEVEDSYAQKLKKIGNKINVLMKDEQGTVAASLNAVGITMSEEALQHEELHEILSNKIVTNFKEVIKTYEATLKQVDKEYEKVLRKLNENRTQTKNWKKKCYSKAKEGKKDLKSDQEYYFKCLNLEISRSEFEILTIKYVGIIQSMEKLRLTELHRSCVMYHNHFANWFTRTTNNINELEHVINNSSPINDVMLLANEKKENTSMAIVQYLPDCPNMDWTYKMDVAARHEAADQCLAWVRECLETEQQSNFDSLKALQELDKNDPRDLEKIEATNNRLILSSALQDYLEACEWKFALVDKYRKVNFRYSQYVIQKRDVNNNPASFLKLPISSIIQVMAWNIDDLWMSGRDDTLQPPIAPRSSNLRAVDNYQQSKIFLKKGDAVFVILTWDHNWWLVHCKGRVGEVPSISIGE